ncbi:MAG TPA: FAD-dependent monooxygenase, partial [Actinomycetota bacterium]
MTGPSNRCVHFSDAPGGIDDVQERIVKTTDSVAIIGASAAGLTTARLLAERGRPVTVYERSPSLDVAERSLIVTSRMRDIMGARTEGAVASEVRRFELFTDGRSASVDLRRPDLIVRRHLLIPELARQAVAAGARLELGAQRLHLVRARLELGPQLSDLPHARLRGRGLRTELLDLGRTRRRRALRGLELRGALVDRIPQVL